MQPPVFHRPDCHEESTLAESCLACTGDPLLLSRWHSQSTHHRPAVAVVYVDDLRKLDHGCTFSTSMPFGKHTTGRSQPAFFNRSLMADSACFNCHGFIDPNFFSSIVTTITARSSGR